jgi:hypothetical protein
MSAQKPNDAKDDKKAEQTASRKDSFFDQERRPHKEFQTEFQSEKMKLHIRTNSKDESSEDDWYLPTPPTSPGGK